MVPSSRLGWIGVDIGTRSVKLAQAERTPGGVRIRHAAVIQRPDPWPDEDALGLDDPSPSSTEIMAAVECGGFSGRSAACLLPMNVCELRGLNVPQGDEAERRAMIANEFADDWAGRRVPVEFDYWESGLDRGSPSVDGYNVNVLSVARPWIAQAARDCQQARLDCWAIDGGPLAVGRAAGMVASSRGDQRILAIEWGFSNTTLCIVGNDRPLYVRRLHECGFRRCLEAVQSALGVTLDEAQYLVDAHGIGLPDEESGGDREIQYALTSVLADRVAELVEGVQRTLRFVESQRRHLRPTSGCLMGGGASVRNMGPYLSKAIALPMNVWGAPAEQTLDSIAHGKQAAIFAGAIALSMLAWRAA